MKNIVFPVMCLVLLQFSACKKDDSISNEGSEAQYTVDSYKNGAHFHKYSFTNSKLLKYHTYNIDGELIDTIQFFYNNGRLDSSASVSLAYGTRRITTYSYNSQKQLVKIEKRESTMYTRVFDITYDNSNRMEKIDWYLGGTPFSGEFFIDNYGNVFENKNKYPDGNDNYETNILSFNSYHNILKQFWVISPSIVSISENNPVEQIQNTETYIDGGGGQSGYWEYSDNYWAFEYSDFSDGNIATKSVLDSNDILIDFYNFEYIGF